MKLPAITCLCTTFGRAKCLAESLDNFLNQDYEGDLELIILNDCIRQTYIVDSQYQKPRRRIHLINSNFRYKNLGEKRHDIVRFSSYDWIMTWGDDDIHLPWECTESMKEVLKHQADMGIIGRFYAAVGTELTLKTGTPCGPFLMKKDMYYKLGGFEALNVGEDANLQTRAVRDKNYKVVKMMGRPAFIYRWGNGNYHISGLGQDKQGKRSAWDVIEEMVNKRIDEGKEPEGLVVLEPRSTYDWIAAISDVG